MTQLWTIVASGTSEVLAPCFATASTGQHPKDAGWAWDATTQRATRIDTAPDLTIQTWSGTAWVVDVAKLKTATITRLKDEAEMLKMRSMTPGGAKKEEYAANKAEVRDADQLGGALLATLASLKLTAGAIEARFPQATANAAEFGDTISDALNRYRAGIARSSPCPKISGREARVCADIRAATTVAAVNAILARHKWPTA